MAEVRWQDICDNKLNVGIKSKKLIRQTILVFYASFESNIVPGCNIFVPKIGKFKGTDMGLRHLDVVKRRDYVKTKHKMKVAKRRQREWARMKFDDCWQQDPNF